MCDVCHFDWHQPPATAAALIAGAPGAVARALDIHRVDVRERPASRTWSIVEYAAHLADVLQWYSDRLTRMHAASPPQFETFDWDAACVVGSYNTRDVAAVLADIAVAAHTCHAAAMKHADSGWQAIAIGSGGGERTAASQVSRAAHEVIHHLFDLDAVALRLIVQASPIVDGLLDRFATLSLPSWYLGAGAIAQTVWNEQHGFDPSFGIKDYDLVYFDADDLSESCEDATEDAAREIAHDLGSGIRLDVTNEARVHQWYGKRFGREILPYVSCEAAIATWPTTATAVGVRRDLGGGSSVCAPFGLSDLFAMHIRPNKAIITQAVYEAKVSAWQARWPGLTIFPW